MLAIWRTGRLMFIHETAEDCSLYTEDVIKVCSIEIGQALSSVTGGYGCDPIIWLVNKEEAWLGHRIHLNLTWIAGRAHPNWMALQCYLFT